MMIHRLEDTGDGDSHQAPAGPHNLAVSTVCSCINCREAPAKAHEDRQLLPHQCAVHGWTMNEFVIIESVGRETIL